MTNDYVTADQERALNPIANLVGVAALVYSTYATIVAFTGGTLWPIGLEMAGGVGSGLFFIVVIDPILMTVFYWIGLIMLSPIVMAMMARNKRRAA